MSEPHVTEKTVEEAVDYNSEEMEDPELEALKQRMVEMEKEAQRLRELQDKMGGSSDEASKTGESEAGEAGKDDVDARSIYVGNVDYSATPEELQEHFKASGTINRVTILCDKFTGHPKGYAYIEFEATDAVTSAQLLDGSMFHGRPIKVNPKRTNLPGMARGRGRGRGFRGGYYPRPRGFHRGRGRGAYYSPY